jgi:adenosylcobyric acid synthase
VALLPDDLRALVGGFIINKLRGDPALLAGGPAELQRRTGVPTLGVLPWVTGVGFDAEDSLALRDPWPTSTGRPDGEALDVAVIRFPRISNFTDLDPLSLQPGVRLRLVTSGRALGHPDLVVLPGTKSTVADLAWLRETGLATAVAALAADPSSGTTVLGICGGYQMMGGWIDDAAGVEAPEPGRHAGLGLLASETRFEARKQTRLRRGLGLGQPLSGYQIHHGRTTTAHPWITLADPDEPEGSRRPDGRVCGTSLHGLFDSDGFRSAFLAEVATRSGRPWAASGVSFAAARDARLTQLADLLEAHLDLPAVERLITSAPRPAGVPA